MMKFFIDRKMFLQFEFPQHGQKDVERIFDIDGEIHHLHQFYIIDRDEFFKGMMPVLRRDTGERRQQHSTNFFYS